MFAIIDRYVLREVATALAGVTAVLLAILVSYQLARILGELDRRGATPDVLVVSDHGYSTIARRIQLEEVVREAGFPAGDRPGGVTVAANGGAGLFYVRDSEPRALERFTRWLVGRKSHDRRTEPGWRGNAGLSGRSEQWTRRAVLPL